MPLSNCRYHVHIIGVAHHQPQVLDLLAMFFYPHAFLTCDVSSELPKANLYSRQCIEVCDYTVVVVGDKYGFGTAQNMGVSQMHLSYLNAKAKLKPMLILLKKHDEQAKISPQLQDFIKLLKQQANNIYYYNEDTDINELLNKAYYELAGDYDLEASWVKSSYTSSILISNSERLAQPSNSTNTNSSSPSTSASNIMPPTTSTKLSYSNQSLNIDSSAVSVDIAYPIELAENITVEYNAQAYEGGNLTDITMTMELTWQQVLQALSRVPGVFSNYGLQSCMNRLVTAKAEHDIKQKMPNVHAVSRCRIVQSDLDRLQHLLVTNHWIQATETGSNTLQELWKLHPNIKKLLNDYQSR